MLQDAENTLISTKELDRKAIRLGRYSHSDLYWREDNYKHVKTNSKSAGIEIAFSPNLAYAKVSSVRRAEFDRALDSFVRAMETNAVGGR